jgi:hypothetical protein
MKKATIACAYCGALVTVDLGDIKLTRRAVRQTAFQCPSCDSKTEIQIATKRIGKGKRCRLAEKKAEEAWIAAVAVRAAENKAAGDALLAEPGCDCKPSPYYDNCTYNGQNSGHFLSTGWSRDGGFMLPTRPQHRHGCPARKP